MARIFLSYAREDKGSAKALSEAMAAHGHSVWWDEHIRGGARFAAEIDRELQSADVVIVLWSASSTASPWVLDEAAEARDSGKLIPIALGGCKPPLGFRQFQTIPLPVTVQPTDRALAKIADAVVARSGAAAEPGSARRAPPLESRLSVCVLPFANIGGDPEQEYFSDGITEDVITDLSKVSSLDVIARNAAFAFRGRSVDEKEIAAALGATHLVEGSIRKIGERVRITAQLIEAKTCCQLWAERYDRDLTDIFAIQDEISKAIVEALELNLLPSETKAIEARSTSDALAYDLYLKARRRWLTCGRGNAGACDEIVELCRQATGLDPDYARAWALMALAQSDLAFWSGRIEDPLAAAERSIAIDPGIAEAYVVRTRRLANEGTDEAARSAIEEVLRFDGESWDANREAARLALAQGRLDDMVVSLERACAAVKTDHESAATLVACHAAAGDSERGRQFAELAIARAERIVISDPKNGAAYASGACGLAALGHADRARKWIRKALNTDPANQAMRYSLGSTLAALLGDPDTAAEVIEPIAEVATKRQLLAFFEMDPAWDPLRELPRFRRLVEHARKRIESMGATSPAMPVSAVPVATPSAT